jgi:hypothetical protein
MARMTEGFSLSMELRNDWACAGASGKVFTTRENEGFLSVKARRNPRIASSNAGKSLDFNTRILIGSVAGERVG